LLHACEQLESIWERVRRELRTDASDLAFHVWLEPLELVGRDRETLFVSAPKHLRPWVKERYLPAVRRAASRALACPIVAELVDEDWREQEASTAGGTSAVGTSAAGASRGGGGGVDQIDQLNPKYSFDQFVIGESNRLAHAAALAVAELPAQAFNPLFIHGPPGLGKTHLLHAIGNYVQRYGDGLTVRYATVETFTSEFVQAVRRRDTDRFRERFRGVDVLLIDDIQFIADKLRTKEEFFHTFNGLCESGRQLVITSDKPPSDMAEFEARLRERFGSGLVVDLSAPELAVRTAILRKRARHDALDGFGDPVLVEIARRVSGSVRALEGALIRVVAYSSLRSQAATPETVAEALGTAEPATGTANCGLVEIQAAVAEAFEMTPEALLASDRRPKVAFARQMAMYLSRELTDETLPAIGRSFGGRNHSTVLHAHRKIAAGLDSDRRARQVVDSVRDKLATRRPLSVGTRALATPRDRHR